MTDRLDDYRDDMGRLDSKQIEAVLSGDPVSEPGAERAAAAVAELRRALIEKPAAGVATRHLAAMRAAVRAEPMPATPIVGRTNSMGPLTRRRTAILAVAATMVLAAGVAAAVTLPPQANDTAETNVPAEPEVIAGRPQTLPPAEAIPPAEGVPPAESDHGRTVSEIAQTVEECDDALDLAHTASGGRLDRAELPVDPCTQGDASTSGGAGGPANGGGGPPDNGGGGGGSGPGGGGGGSGGPEGGGGGGSSITGAGGSGSGGPSGGGGGGSGPGGGGGGSDGPDGGSGGGGPVAGSAGAPVEVPTPTELPTP